MKKIFKEKWFYSDLENIVKDLKHYFNSICDFSEDWEFCINSILEKFKKAEKEDNEYPLDEIFDEIWEIQKLVSTLETLAELLRKKEKKFREKILSLDK